MIADLLLALAVIAAWLLVGTLVALSFGRTVRTADEREGLR